MLWRTIAIGLVLMGSASAQAQPSAGPDFPPFERVSEGFTKIPPPTGEMATMYDVYVRQKDSQVLLELPKNFADKKYFIGVTVASGQLFAGLQVNDFYVQWRQYNNRMALIEPNVRIRATGDNESRDSVSRLFTGRVLLDLPIVTLSPRGGPVIDGDQMMVGSASTFFGPSGRTQNPMLAKLVKSKAFPLNIEMAFEMPSISGTLQALHYSISEIPTSTGYAARNADERIGYFTTSYSDYGQYKEDKVKVHYINRWHLQKKDPSLKISPPVEPIRFYVEHTTPVRYRRWVKQGVDYWNKAYERIGLSDAIEIHYQDKSTRTHMEKDPEDVRYNFIRWLNNNIGTAIGPSRVHPETGQILDADIVLTDGWIRHFDKEFADYMPLVAMEGMSPESIAWLAEHPNWDPRVRFATPSQRTHISHTIRNQATRPFAGYAESQWKTPLMGDDPLDGLIGRNSQVNGQCLASQGRHIDTAVMRMLLDIGPAALVDDDDDDKDEKKKDEKEKKKDGKDAKQDESKDVKSDATAAKEEKKDEPKSAETKAEPKKDAPKKPEESLLDGMPESFVGPLLADLVAHEVGHTLGLRHNFKSSSIYTLKEINSNEIKSKKAFAGSVMDYLPLNLRLKDGEVQGDYGMIDLGPYDYWAIEYGYTFDKNLEPILARVSEPELQFATDEDTVGPDPLARRYDFSKNPIEYAREQRILIERFRKRLLADYVKNGERWTKARQGYELTLNLQMRNISMMSNWVGGAHINRDRKGDPKGRSPIEVVPAATQREALAFVLESTFRDDSFALSPELLSRLTKNFFDDSFSQMTGDPAWPVHDRILSMQSSALTQLMNASTLRKVYDNEFRVAADQDAFTLPELLDGIRGEIWSELDKKLDKQCTARQPMISSLRRNLQREHLERLIDLTLPGNGSAAAYKAISNLCTKQLRDLNDKIASCMKDNLKSMDPYSESHLAEASQRITKALDASYVYNQQSGAGGVIQLILGQPTDGSDNQPKE